MKPLASWPAASRRGIRGVLTDIDDTLTTEGAVTSDVLRALDELCAAGVHVIPITGRPVGWSEPFALGWPVDAIVAENGAMVRRSSKGSVTCASYTDGHHQCFLGPFGHVSSR